VVLDLSEATDTCSEWEITAFRLTVYGVTAFSVTIGQVSSGIIEVLVLLSHQ